MTNVLIVIDDQDDLGAVRQRASGGRGFGGGGLCVDLRAWKIQLDRRTTADFAVKFHMAAGLAYEAVDLAQPEPGASADFLGRVERLERALRLLGGHTGPGIADGDEDIRTGRDVA